jgi:hypothetical protein
MYSTRHERQHEESPAIIRSLLAAMNVYGNASLRARQQADSKVVQMVMKHEQPEAELQAVAE